MKHLQRISLLLVLILLTMSVDAQVLTTNWQRSVATSNLPLYFGADTERGMSYGKVGGIDYVFVVSRKGTPGVIILNAATGDSIGVLNVTGVSGGTFVLNDIEVSEDGVIFAANLTTTANTNPFKIYRWDSLTAVPTVAVNFTGAFNHRFGDKITVTGRLSDNSATIWAAVGAQDSVYRWTTTDNGANWTPTAILLSDGASGNQTSVTPYPGVGFLLKSSGQSVKVYNGTGTLQYTIPGDIVATGASAIKYFEQSGKKFFAVHQFGSGNNNARIVEILGTTSYRTHLITPTQGSATNANGAGDVSIRLNGDNTVELFVLSTNNGISSHNIKPAARVTFNLNTATRVDTIKATSQVEVRGGAAPLTWGDDSPNMGNIGGDYWSVTHMFPLGNIEFKYYAEAWEDGSNKTLNVTKDTVLPLAFFNYGYNPPFTPSDSIDVWFRVNMGSRADINYNTDTVMVRGSFPGNDWGPSNRLNREGTSKFFSNVFRFPNSAAGSTINYKFTFGAGATTNWEDAIGNRTATLNKDTTLVWKTFEDKAFVTVVADSYLVYFVINTSTVPDTLKPTSTVQLRGSKAPLTWGADSPVRLANIGGDYWLGSAKFFGVPGDEVFYKIYTNAKPFSELVADDGGKGWEADIGTGGNRSYILGGDKDTTLPLQFVNAVQAGIPQYFRPWTPSDSIEVLFRVNMQGNENFNPTNQFVAFRGSILGDDSWGTNYFLGAEKPHANNGSRQYDATKFYSGVFKIAPTVLNAERKYKFVITNDSLPGAAVTTWESRPDRVVPGKSNPVDTTLAWVWWNDAPPVPFQGSDTLIITFRANMARALSERGFTHSDTLEVRTGYGGSASTTRTKRMVRQGITTTYQAVDTVISAKGKTLYYQYYLIKNNADLREIYYDFTYKGTDVALAERRAFILPTTVVTATVLDTSTSISAQRRQPRFRNSTRLARVMDVTFTVDMRPAIYQLRVPNTVLIDIQGAISIAHPDSVRAKGVAINGPATSGWAGWGASLWADTSRRMYDNGLNGDLVANDSIYSRKYFYTTTDIVGQEFKFGIGGGDNEGGYGNNHIENINDAAGTFVLANQFGSIDPLFYFAWDFTNQRPITSVLDEYSMIPKEFELRQNYPNPFNPATTIAFGLPKDSKVTLKVFNMLGQEVATLVQGDLKAGYHRMAFDASRLTTGVYFYHLQADGFVSTKKMVLMK